MCYPGTLNSHQGVDLAIAAVNLLRDKLPNLRFLIIGDGPDRPKLEQLIKTLSLQDRVAMMGSMPLEQVAKAMTSVHLGVVPKRSNSFGNEAFSTKIMEFMAMGVPVVAASTKIDRYYFNDHLLEFFEADNAEDLAQKILGLVKDSKRTSDLRSEALAFIRENNWEIRKGEYLNLIDRLVGMQVAKPLAVS